MCRPPLDAYTVEFPAGLIDKGESAETAAARELKEETGEVQQAVERSEIDSLQDTGALLVLQPPA